MAVTIQGDELSAEVGRILTMYGEEVYKGIQRQTAESMKQLVTETKATAPVGHRKKHYKNSISSRVIKKAAMGYAEQWYVKGSDYRLSHLLNNGHMLRDGGRYQGTKFITKAAESVVQDYERKLREVVANAGG